ncbi:hypothetical protein EJB05_53000 [Eragrostis curvula]|uniref:Uncharacterized protein n=1 Tax=Eragrostis curvula TaxID=38414 RepID=A0A5J9SRE2_9POAL|nr:hypothetical protein EJB05_53000 [Eragrostis curvula]
MSQQHTMNKSSRVKDTSIDIPLQGWDDVMTPNESSSHLLEAWQTHEKTRNWVTYLEAQEEATVAMEQTVRLNLTKEEEVAG